MSGERFVLRSVTDEIMYELMLLSGQEYVDTYARRQSAEARKAAAEGTAVADERRRRRRSPTTRRRAAGESDPPAQRAS